MNNTDEENIKLTGVYKKKTPSTTKNFIFIFLLIILIVISIVFAGFFGTEFLTLYVFVLIFGFPLIMIYKDSILSILPSRISSLVVSEVTDIKNEIKDNTKTPTKTVVSVSRKEYQTLFLGCMCLAISMYLLIKKNDKLPSILLSVFFGVLSNIILGDLF